MPWPCLHDGMSIVVCTSRGRVTAISFSENVVRLKRTGVVAGEGSCSGRAQTGKMEVKKKPPLTFSHMTSQGNTQEEPHTMLLLSWCMFLGVIPSIEMSFWASFPAVKDSPLSAT